MGQTDHAVVCGIKNYPAFPPLGGPELDALAFKKWLVDDAKVPENQIRLVLSSQFASDNVAGQPVSKTKPTLEALDAKFRELKDLTVKNFAKPTLPRVGRRLYIYLSGHGITPRSYKNNREGAAALLMANASPQDPGYHLAATAYAEWFRLSHAFEEILLFMDCCRNAFEDIDEMPVPFGVVKGGNPGAVKKFVALGTQWDAPSFEQPIGTPPVPRGVFTYALIETFKTLRDERGQLRAKALEGPLRTAISTLRKGDVPQWPKLTFGDDSHDIVILEEPVARLRVTIEWDARFLGKTLHILDGFGQPLDPEVTVVPGPHAVPIELRRGGLYQVVETPPQLVILNVVPGMRGDQQGVGRVTVE